MEHCKLQIGCIVVLLYVAFIYLHERRNYQQQSKSSLFDKLLLLGIIAVTLDGISAYTVNHLDTVDPVWNRIVHAGFLISLDTVIFVLCLYMLVVTGAYPKRRIGKIIIFAPFVMNVVTVVANIGTLEYRQGRVTNYSMGISAYTCFVMSAIYTLLTIVVFRRRWNYIESHKRANIFTYLLVQAAVTGIQMIFPETLISSIAVTVFILGVYLNLEDPALKRLSHYHSETVMAFANLIENRDNSTGGHVKRTSQYVRLIAEELRDSGQYRDVLTRDYIENLVKAAPMHDIGKIAVPDAILQKPGKLTEEEFAIMKLHASKGGEIISETFRNLGSNEYYCMAFEVARYHHEKWNGTGYPEGRKQEEIPLSARIMAVADVFDAVSEKRCYREAMPLETCFAIIEQGSGKDFDPGIVEVFRKIRPKLELVYGEMAR